MFFYKSLNYVSAADADKSFYGISISILSSNINAEDNNFFNFYLI